MPEFVDSDKPQFIDEEGPKFIDASGPQEAPKQEESTLSRVVKTVANAPMIMTPETYAKGVRAITGRQEPYAFEQYVPTPTLGRFVKSLYSPSMKVAQLAGNVVGLGDVVNPAVSKVENYYKENVAPSLSGEAAGFIVPAVLSGLTSAAPEAAAATANAGRFATNIRNLLAAYRAAGTTGGPGEAALASLGKAALASGATAALSTPVPEAKSASDVFKETGKQFALGGAVGGLTGAVSPLATSVASGIRDYMQTKIDPLKAVSVIDDAIAASKATGKPIQLKPSQVYYGAKKQPQTLEDYAANARAFDEQLQKDFAKTPFGTLGELRAAAADHANKYSERANVLLRALDESGGSAAATLPNSLKITALNEKLRLYSLGQAKDALAEGVTGRYTNAADEVARQIKAVGSDLLKSQGQKDAEIAYLKNLERSLRGPSPEYLASSGGRAPVLSRPGVEAPRGGADSLGLVNTGRSPVVGGVGPQEEVRDIYGTIIKPGRPAQGGVTGSAGPNAPTGTPGSIWGGGKTEGFVSMPTFQQGTKAIQTINDDLAKAYKGENLVTGSGDAAFLKRFKDAIRNDQTIMANFSGKNDLIAMNQRFNQEYSKYAGTWKDPAILGALKSDNYNEIIAGLTKAGPDKAGKVFGQMEPRGQAAYLSHSFRTAMESAEDKATGQFSTEKFVEGLKKQFDVLGLTKNPQVKGMVAGLTNLGEALNLSKSATMVPITDIAREGAWAASGSKAGHALRLLDRLRSHGIDFLFDSPGGMDFLYKAGKLSPKNPAFWDNLERVGRRIVPIAETANQESK